MKFVEKEAKSVDEAILQGLSELGLSIGEVDIEVLEEGTKGLFSIIGSKQAKVRITERVSDVSLAKTFLENALEKMGLEVLVTEESSDTDIFLSIQGEKIGSLIGYRGETLDALQYLTSLMVNKNKENYIRVTVDAGNYRQKREMALKKLAGSVAEKVRLSGRRMAMEPMNPFERRILHETLQDNEYVSTISEGEGPNRHIVIMPKKGSVLPQERNSR